MVVNMVDPGPALVGLSRAAREQGVVNLFPLNVAFGAVLLAMGPDSPPLEDLAGGTTDGDLFVRIVGQLMPVLPQYLFQYAGVVERIQREGVAPPQLGVAASLSASLIVTSMVKVAVGSPLPFVPDICTLDSHEPVLRSWPMP